MEVRSRKGRTLSRPPSTLDLMSFVLACAPAMVVFFDRLRNYRNGSPPSSGRTVAIMLEMGNLALMTSTLTLTLVFMRPPRPRLRVLLRCPGAAACLAALVAMLVVGARVLAKSYSMYNAVAREAFRLRYTYSHLLGGENRIGLAVLGAWLMLLMTGAWRPEPSWPDRAGRLLGLGWVLLTLVHVALPWAEPYLPAI